VHWRSRTDLPANPSAASCARAIAQAVVRAWGFPDLVENAQLLVSELFTNALQHAPGSATIGLLIDTRADGVRLGLADGSALRPEVRALTTDRPSGRGLVLVQALASRWGAEEHEDGKVVWVDLDR
jgi:anti-sigma regulatory factor (Ser/Thr protein kinase)